MEWLLSKGLEHPEVPIASLSEGEVSKASYKAVGSKRAKMCLKISKSAAILKNSPHPYI